jgi:hypothetical protein
MYENAVNKRALLTIPSTQIESKIEGYLARIDPARRDYARQYMQWLAGPDCGEPPPRSGVSPQSAKIMRNRIDIMLQGENTYLALPYQIY